MGDSVLAKLIVTVIVLIAFTVWRASDRAHLPGCLNNCPTDYFG
jgi:hypothetical protein